VRRVSLITDSRHYVGPALARVLAGRSHDLVLVDPIDGLVDELIALGAAVEALPAGADDRAAFDSMVAASIDRFGRLDSASLFSGRVITGRFLDSSVDDLRAVTAGCIETPYHFLSAVLPPMIERGEGQVLVFTSATAARPTPGAPLYSAARAGATHLVRNVAHEVARHGVSVNAIGTNFMDFPEFRQASGYDASDEMRERYHREIPLGRLGTMSELAAMAAPFLDGTTTFQTGVFVPYAGGW